MTSRDVQTTKPAVENSDNEVPGLWRRYRRLPRNVVAIGLVSLLNDASSEIIYPLLPVFLTAALGASAEAVGIIEGAAESISSLLKLSCGRFSGLPATGIRGSRVVSPIVSAKACALRRVTR